MICERCAEEYMKFRPVIVTTIFAVLLAGYLFATDTGQQYYQLAKCRYLIRMNHPGWGDEVSSIVRNMISHASDKHQLAERLLSQDDGSLVSEGLILLVQCNHPHGKQLLTQHLDDQRWNYYLELNCATASNCLNAYVSQNKSIPSADDCRTIAVWKYLYVTRDTNELAHILNFPPSNPKETEQNAQQGVPPYVAQGAPSGER